ncbi:hypothetical protein GCM10023323_66840 [Streptomyces thinghirensis]|uniref:DUF4352 domain-containing protein n=1 Tax=Streptomyces thinghirensis TaxID=551547 RepID=A0ABP9TF56_9ACTN
MGGCAVRAYIRRAVVPAVVLSVVLLTGCGGRDSDEGAAPQKSSAAEAAVDEPAQEPSEDAHTPVPGPNVGIGRRVTFSVGETDEYGQNYKVTTKMDVRVLDVKYMTPAELDAAKDMTLAELDTTNEPEHGQYLTLTLMLENVGDAPAKITTYGMMKWQDANHAAQDATTLESVGGPALDRTYAPGQSVIGALVLDVAAKGGTVSYYGTNDPSGEPAFVVTLPSE